MFSAHRDDILGQSSKCTETKFGLLLKDVFKFILMKEEKSEFITVNSPFKNIFHHTEDSQAYAREPDVCGKD